VTVFLVTGIQAAGKSTVAQALAERLERSVHVRGDLFRRMVVNGGVEMGPADPWQNWTHTSGGRRRTSGRGWTPPSRR
jgi:adenylylsulfate kinase-like enzyme